MAFLTDRSLATGVTLQDLIHIVITGDTSQGNFAGSSYKATIQQVSDIILSGSTDYYVTGGTYSGGTLVLDRQNGSVTITGFTTGSTQLYEVGSGSSSVQLVNVSGSAIGDYSVVSGGLNNTSKADYSTVSGGQNNTSSGDHSFIGGGSGNTANNCFTFIGGGRENITSGFYSTISGGYCNTSSGGYSTVSGGLNNTTSGYWSTVGGGLQNTSNGQNSTISGGRLNKSICLNSTISGGYCNTAISTSATVSGGLCNTSSGCYSFVGGGWCNTSSCYSSSIVGGKRNTTFSNYGTILGGSGNTVTHQYSSTVGKDVKSVSACTFHVNYLALQNTPETDVQTTTQYLTRDSTTGVVKTKIIPGPTVYGLFAQTGNSTTIISNVEGTLIGGGVGTLSVPANGFSVGDSFRADFGGTMSARNGETITIRIKSGIGGTTTISTSPTFALPGSGVSNQVWLLSLNFTVRAIGPAGTASIVALAELHVLKLASGTQEGYGWNTVDISNFNTTVNNTLNVTAQWGSNTPLQNAIYSDIFVLNKIY